MGNHRWTAESGPTVSMKGGKWQRGYQSLRILLRGGSGISDGSDVNGYAGLGLSLFCSNGVSGIASRTPPGTHGNGTPPISSAVSRLISFHSNNMSMSPSYPLPVAGIGSGLISLCSHNMSTISSCPNIVSCDNCGWTLILPRS